MSAYHYQSIAHDASISAECAEDDVEQVIVNIVSAREGVEVDVQIRMWAWDFLRMADMVRESLEEA